MSILECGLDLKERNLKKYRYLATNMHISLQFLPQTRAYSDSFISEWRANILDIYWGPGGLGCWALGCISLPLHWCSWEIQKPKTSKTWFHIRNNTLFSCPPPFNFSMHTTYSQLWCLRKFQETCSLAF